MRFVASMLSVAAGSLCVATVITFTKGETTKGIIAGLVVLVLLLGSLVFYLLADDE